MEQVCQIQRETFGKFGNHYMMYGLLYSGLTKANTLEPVIFLAAFAWSPSPFSDLQANQEPNWSILVEGGRECVNECVCVRVCARAHTQNAKNYLRHWIHSRLNPHFL